MNKTEYKKYRIVIVKEYEMGLLTPKELGEALAHLTDTYRKANNIAKFGK